LRGPDTGGDVSDFDRAVRALVNHASGGIDHLVTPLQLRYIARMKTGYTFLTTAILFCLAGLHASTGMADTPPVPMGETAKKPALKQRKPVTCEGTKDVVLDKVIIEADGPAVTVTGSCDVTIKNSVIRTTGSAIVIKGSGDVTIIDSTVESKGTALLIQGSGDIDVRGSQITGATAARLDGSGDLVARDSRFRGKKTIRGTGEYKNSGGNTWEQK
jgi:hypothetical protein